MAVLSKDRYLGLSILKFGLILTHFELHYVRIATRVHEEDRTVDGDRRRGEGLLWDRVEQGWRHHQVVQEWQGGRTLWPRPRQDRRQEAETRGINFGPYRKICDTYHFIVNLSQAKRVSQILRFDTKLSRPYVLCWLEILGINDAKNKILQSKKLQQLDKHF